MQLIEEVAAEDQPSVNAQEEIHQYPAYIQQFFNQLLNPNNEESGFFREVKLLANQMRIHFNQATPRFFTEVWLKRKKDFEILEAAIRVANISSVDLLLFIACRTILSSDTFFDSFSWNHLPEKLKNAMFPWNSLPEKLKTILNDYNLNLNLLPDGEDDGNKQKFLRLVCDYHLVYQKMLDLKSQLENRNVTNNYPQRIENYRALRLEKDRVIESLRHQKQRLEDEKQQLIKLSKKENSLTDIYLRMNEKLEIKLKELSQKIEKVMANGKVLGDENNLLKIRCERLNEENKFLHTTCDGLLKHNQQLDKERSGLMAENENLRRQLSAINSTLKTKTKELAHLKTNISQAKIKLFKNYSSEIERFVGAAQMSEQNYNELSQIITKMIYDIEKEVADISLTNYNQNTFF